MKRTWREHLFVLSVFIPACIVGVSVAVAMSLIQDLNNFDRWYLDEQLPKYIRREKVEMERCYEVKGAAVVGTEAREIKR